MKERLDVLLVKNSLADSRQKAQALIMSGVVLVNDVMEDKCGLKVDDKATIRLKKNILKYVSRGGYKLEKAILEFNINLDSFICMDVGASSGGFTDCMLQNGADKVYAVDVGYGQLDYKLRVDDRVVVLERTNFRYLDDEIIKDRLNFISIDVSFISLSLIMPKAKSLLCDNGRIMALIKPQFEVGKADVGNGVIRDPVLHKRVILDRIKDFRELNLFPVNLDFSPIKGPKGNIEFLIYLSTKIEEENKDIDVDKIVAAAHEKLDKE